MAVTAVNDTAVRFYGYSRNEFLSLRITDLLVPENVASMLPRLHSLESGAAGPLRHRRKDGSIAWVDAAFRTMAEFAEPSYPTSIRQPILILAAGQDDLVSTPAIGEFAQRLRAGASLVISGSRHEILMERDRFRLQFWAAFDAFVPGSPLYG